MARGWRSNQNQNFRWKQDVGSSNKRASFQQQSLYPSIQERLSKFEDTLEKFMQASLASQENDKVEIKKLETQAGHIAKKLAERQSG